MKKRGVGVVFAFLAVLIFSIVLSSFLASAANQTDTSSKAYSCLEAKVTGKCASLSSEEKIFSLLAINSCKPEVLADSSAGNCWPDSGCKIKATAQAILALSSVNTDTKKAEDWLLSQVANSEDLDWFLQVDGNQTSCTVSYSQGSNHFTINADKTLAGNLGNCLTIYNNYWMKISPSCYDLEFQISCSDSFLTSLLYKKATSPTVYVSQKTDSARGEGTTTEKVSSSCFREGNLCSYEGTLWAAMVLKYKKYDVSSYIPYLTAMADENSQFIPESFLQYLTNSFRTELLAKQSSSSWWSASDDKFYDTAVALLPFQNQQLSEKTNAIKWLSEIQGTDGCWQGNIGDTAFLLYSIWPKKITPVSSKDCEASGNFCVSNAECADVSGTIQPDYTGCFTKICCDKQEQLQSCSEQNGEKCSSDEVCSRQTVDSSDGSCCTGACEPKSQSTCEQNGGYCRSTCSSEEEPDYQYTCSSGTCCIQKPSPGVSILVIVILSILIVLVLLGILFRKQLSAFLSKMKFGKGKAKPSGTPPGRFPPSSAARGYPMQRRILMPTQQSRVPMRRPPSSPGKKEFDDVVKKLKEIGK